MQVSASSSSAPGSPLVDACRKPPAAALGAASTVISRVASEVHSPKEFAAEPLADGTVAGTTRRTAEVAELLIEAAKRLATGTAEDELTGPFKDDTWAQGGVAEYRLRKGKVHGEVTVTYPDGKKKYLNVEDGILHGMLRTCFPDGRESLHQAVSGSVKLLQVFFPDGRRVLYSPTEDRPPITFFPDARESLSSSQEGAKVVSLIDRTIVYFCKEGMREGLCTTTSTDGRSVIVHTYKNNVYHGPCRIIVREDKEVELEYENDQLNGKMKIKYHDNNKAEFNFENDHLEEQALFKFSNGREERMTYCKDSLEGPAESFARNGAVTYFTYRDGVREGDARTEHPDGRKEYFTYKNGVREGDARTEHPDGRIEFFTYNNDVCVVVDQQSEVQTRVSN